jgi:hypothetical protein
MSNITTDKWEWEYDNIQFRFKNTSVKVILPDIVDVNHIALMILQ